MFSCTLKYIKTLVLTFKTDQNLRYTIVLLTVVFDAQ